jgi:hypothetical protein
MIKIFVTVLLISVISFSQESDSKFNFIYKFQNQEVSLLLTGIKKNDSQKYISAKEVFVIDNITSDTLLFVDALQYCHIVSDMLDTVSIIGRKMLPYVFSQNWTSQNYLRYNFTLDSNNKIIIDTVWLLQFPKPTVSDKENVEKEYRDVFNRLNEGNKYVPYELVYYVLYLALDNDDWAIEKLFCMARELKFSGYLNEINEDAINIYKIYNRIK